MKRKLILTMAILFIGVISLCCFTSCSSAKTVDFGKYTTVSFSGYNGSGYATVKVDYETIAAMLGEQNTASALMVLSTIKPSEIENNGSLSNGDKIKVKIEYNESTLEEVNLAAANTDLEFEVKGLEEKQELDFFKDVTVEVEGISPFCTVKAKYNGDIEGIQEPFNKCEVTDLNGEFQSCYKNGDTVIVSLSNTMMTSLSEYNLKETSKEYTVNTDTAYITTAADLSADNLAELDRIAEAAFNEKVTELIESGSSSSYQREQFIKSISGMSIGSAAITNVDNMELKAKYIGCTDSQFGEPTMLGTSIYNHIYYFYDVDVTFDWKYFTNTGTETVNCTFAVCLTNSTITADEITYTEAELYGAADQAAAKSKLIDNADFAFEEF